MAVLRLSFLGTFAVHRDDVPITTFRGDKVRALLAYLAVESVRSHARSSLAGLFWPEQTQDAALNNLSQTLGRLRAALGSVEPPVLLLTRQAVGWNSASAAAVDVTAFMHLARSTTIVDLEAAAALYGGPFLPGFALSDSEEFEEWIALTRAHVDRLAIGVLDTLARAYLEARSYAEAEAAARRQLALDPWRESPHRQVMEALAGAGQRAAALAHYAACRRVLQDELGVAPDAATTALYERLQAGTVTPEDDTALGAHILPVALTLLVGREADLAALDALLRQEDVRLLTLLGAGGMGKTRLALELARASLDTYADGVFFVALAPLADAGALASAIAQALDLPVHGDDPSAALPRFVHDKHLLLILDNFEHLLDGAELVVDLLQAAPRVQIIATSRERLNVRGEQLYVVEGLAHAPGPTSADIAPLPAVRLLVQSARRAQASFAPDLATLPTLLRICQLVQGMPLGLELAAAWTGLLPLDEIVAELARGADFLAADWPDVPERQRSMRAVFDWSWTLLTDADRQVFRRLSAFRGGFTRQAAESIAGATLGALIGLAHKSLLRRTDAGATSAGRYEIHELLRQFAAEQLDGVPVERDAVRARHSAFYLEFVAARERRLVRDEPREAAAEIRGELDNIRQAWTWAAEHAEVAALEQAVHGWWQFCLLNGLESEGRQLFGLAAERVRRALDQLGPDHEDRRQYERGLSVLLAIHANHLFGHGPYDLMAAQAREAMCLGAASGGVEGETLGSYVLGRALQELEQHRDAQLMWERTIELARTYQPRHASSEILRDAEWLAHTWLVGSSLFFGDYVGGGAHAMEALRICQSLRKRRGEMFCLSTLALIDFYAGDDVAARQRYEQVLPLARALDDRWYEQRVQRELSEVLRVQGQYGQARAMLVGVATVAHEIGDWYYATLTLAALVRLHCQLGDSEGAHAWRDQLVQLMGREGVTYDCKAAGLRACAVYALHTGNHRQALADAEHGMQLTEQYDIPNFRAEAAVILGHARAGMHQLAEAATAYHQALAWYAKIGNASLAVEPQAGLARLALAQGDCVRAQALAEPLLPVLAGHPRASVHTPCHAYLICYRVLVANRDPRAAAVLQMAQQRLYHAAESIEDIAYRRSFLENVAAHRDLVRVGSPL